MSHDGPQPPDEPAPAAHSGSHSVRIRDARAQVETARLRRQRAAPSASLPEGALPGYTIVRELHRGGQGVVYLAVQRSTERKVAIKVLNRGPVATSPTALARFEREVGALSLLKHPNIVTIHDCGRDGDHVYLVMDYVDGRALDAYVDREQTPVADTLRLFAKICDGVNAAHLRGVIHRDLKPGNILVDERGEPHVLDFGLAKLADEAPDASALPEMTATGQFVGSLPWASPEQAEGRADELDIRTDVYSLGVVLYQLLTGRFPYPVSGRLTDVVRHIVHTDPARPTTVDRRVDRELETMLLKCLAKEPDRRYQSAGDVARDIRRYLAGHPIEARRDSLVYVMTKRLARYRATAIASAAVLLIVVAALVVSLTLWRRAGREAAHSRAVVEFMREVLTSVEPEQHGADVRLVQVLAGASAAASERFAAHPQQEAQVRDLLGQVYTKLSLWPEAEAEYRSALALWQRHAGADDPRALADELNCVGMALNVSRVAEAERALQDLMPRLARALGPDHPRTLLARRSWATVLLQRGRADEAEAILLELRTHEALADDDAAQIHVAQTLIDLLQDRHAPLPDGPERRAILAREEALARECVERSVRRFGRHAAVTLQAQLALSEAVCEQGEFRAAADLCRAVLENTRGRMRECHDLRAWAMVKLATALGCLGETDEPATLYLRRIDCLRQASGPGSPGLLAAVSDSLPYLARAGRASEGESLARELHAALLGGGHGAAMALEPEIYTAHFVSMQYRLDEAEALFASLLAREESVPETRIGARLRLFYADHLRRLGRFEEAEQELRSIARGPDNAPAGAWDTHPDDVILAHIALYEAWGKRGQAEEWRRRRAQAVRR